MTNILVNGLGTVGKRVAHAIKMQDDMNLYAVSDVSLDVDVIAALKGPIKGTPLYCTLPERMEDLEGMFEIEGLLPEALESGDVDLVVDCSPGGADVENKPMYEKAGVKAIFQGGADPSIAPVAFSTLANYYEAADVDYVKVVSCNTTSLTRTLWALDNEVGVKKAIASLVRRGGDPKQDKRGPINSIIPVKKIPSHHGPDVQEVMPHLDITTLAVKVPTTLSHVHMVNVELDREVTDEGVKEIFRKTPRIKLFKAEHELGSTAKLMEYFREFRLRGDMPEVAVWDGTVKAEGNRVYWVHQVHQESIIVPENIDAIRSMLGLADREESIRKTDSSLGLDQEI